jgi:2-amino-4-hydroxy-6-hydroxymethyldihydropteridine diphosphokinase
MIILGLGSNLSSSFGDRFKNLELAISYLEMYKIKILKKSSYYETPSYPNKKNPKFINIVVNIETNLNQENLASVLLFIEEKLERKRFKKNDPRTCDIDILDFNNQTINFKYKELSFTVPHKKLTSRSFVLYPLQEIIPGWIHPKTRETINLLIEKLPLSEKNSILKIEKY